MVALNYKNGATSSNFKLCFSVEVEMKHFMGIVTGSSSAAFGLVIGFEVEA